VITSTVSSLLQTVQRVHSEHNFPGTGLFAFADSVWPSRSRDISVWEHFGHDISVHK